MRIGYFGGTFDPPHRAHLAVATAARECFGLDQVLLAPTARQPLKPNGPEAPFADRLRMTELLCAGHPGLRASEVDGPRPGGEPNFTADTLRRLHRQWPTPQHDLFAVAGADAFGGLGQWREPDALLELAEWIVVSRPGFLDLELEQIARAPGARDRVHLLTGVDCPISATALRARLHAGQDCRGLTEESILQYIRSRGLYKGL